MAAFSGGIKTAKAGTAHKKKRWPAVSPKQREVLEELDGTGALTQRQLSAVLAERRTGSMERRLQGLIKRGYVQWLHSDDVSLFQYYITTEGKAMLRGASK